MEYFSPHSDKHLSSYNNYTDINNLHKGASFPVINENMITLEVKFLNLMNQHIHNY